LDKKRGNKKMDQINKFLNENIIFSDKTLLLDKSNFKSNRVLIIIGISGSGKTTLGKKLAEKYNVSLIETDDWFDRQYVNKDTTDEERIKNYNAKIRSLENEIIKKSQKGLVIAEGVQFGCEYENKIFSKNWSCKYAVIILRASLLRATRQRLKRNPNGRFYLKNNMRLIKEVKNWTEQRLKCAKEIDELKNIDLL